MSAITNSARGMACQVRMPGVCNFDPATTVWCHANGSAAGKGIGQKSHDLLGAYACSACHDVVDGRRPHPAGYSRDYSKLAFWEGHARSLRILLDNGLVTV